VSGDIEALLRAALSPVEPPERLHERMETTLDSIVELAADELEAWELSAMKDPRNWPRAALRPAAALVVGSGAAAGLVVLRTQRRRRSKRRRGGLIQDVAREALRVFDELTPGR
jgi:hypothetical protein